METVEVAAGATHSLVRLAGGDVLAFGSNELGQLGADAPAEGAAEPAVVLVALPAAAS